MWILPNETCVIHPRKISTNNMSSLNTNQSPQQLKPQHGKEYFRKEEIWVKVPTIPSVSSRAHCWWWLGVRAGWWGLLQDRAHSKQSDFSEKKIVLFTMQPFPPPCSRTHFRSQKPDSKPCNWTSGSILSLSTSPLDIVHTWNSVSSSENICVHMQDREVEYNTWLSLPRSEGWSPIPGPTS